MVLTESSFSGVKPNPSIAVIAMTLCKSLVKKFSRPWKCSRLTLRRAESFIVLKTSVPNIPFE